MKKGKLRRMFDDDNKMIISSVGNDASLPLILDTFVPMTASPKIFNE